jgi:hypothetical protein
MYVETPRIYGIFDESDTRKMKTATATVGCLNPVSD